MASCQKMLINFSQLVMVSDAQMGDEKL